ncbi:MAG TPA: prolipoprotein diacylglyceryl transferase family protein, partial [Chitinophagaceae bacterium]|nr:prolipoprotein diacylglyceryl transferase family protein [Chitinophagaceae bacterium]
KYCFQLEHGVFPTSFYETVTCFLLFLLIWSLRKRFKIPGTLFAFYLVLNGMERFLVETIRVNVRMNLFGLHPTQAEVISSLLVISGIVLWIGLRRNSILKKRELGVPNAG